MTSGQRLDSDSTQSKEHGRRERNRDARQLVGLRVEHISTEQHGNAGDSQHEGHNSMQPELLAKNRPGEQSRPNRHGVGERCRFTRVQPEQRQSRKPHPGADVEQCGCHKPQPKPGRHRQRLSSGQRDPSQRQTRHQAGDATCGEGRALLEQELRGRPIEAPTKRSHDQAAQSDQPDGPIVRRRHRHDHTTPRHHASERIYIHCDGEWEGKPLPARNGRRFNVWQTNEFVYSNADAVPAGHSKA